MMSQELYEGLKPMKENVETAQLLARRLSVNLSGFYTQLIKDAARCNNYSSDVYYSINEIENAISNYDPGKEFAPIWIGFRKLGVDNYQFIEYRLNNNEKLYNAYFALYSFNVVKDEQYNGFYKVLIREYPV